MRKKLTSFVVCLVYLPLLPIVRRSVDIFANAPECCGEDVEFTGSQSSLFGEVFFYQCQSCKKTFVVHREQKSFSLRHLWKMIFCPKIGETRGDDDSVV